MATLCVGANLFNLNVCLSPGPNARLLCLCRIHPTFPLRRLPFSVRRGHKVSGRRGDVIQVVVWLWGYRQRKETTQIAVSRQALVSQKPSICTLAQKWKGRTTAVRLALTRN